MHACGRSSSVVHNFSSAGKMRNTLKEFKMILLAFCKTCSGCKAISVPTLRKSSARRSKLVFYFAVVRDYSTSEEVCKAIPKNPLEREGYWKQLLPKIEDDLDYSKIHSKWRWKYWLKVLFIDGMTSYVYCDTCGLFHRMEDSTWASVRNWRWSVQEEHGTICKSKSRTDWRVCEILAKNP